MAESGLNLHMTPPLYQPLEPRSLFSELIHSVKASTSCESQAKNLSECRKRPEGKLTNPEKCQGFALSLIDCYREVQQVAPSCKESFNTALSCLQNSGSCDRDLESYLACKPSASHK